MHLFISVPDEEMIAYLLQHGANPNCLYPCEGHAYTYESKYTGNDTGFPLMTMARKELPSLVKLLLESGADSNMTNSIGQSVLHVCHPCLSVIHQIEILELLLTHDADPNLRDDFGRTPLHIACCGSPLEVVEVLLRAGAQGNTVDDNGFSELHLAAHSHYHPAEKVERLLKEFSYPEEVVIEAFETLAFSLLQHINFESLDPVLDVMRQATQMRNDFSLPKTICDPIECYNYAKEWETLEELETYKDSSKLLTIQAVLARERIYSKQFIQLEPLIKFQSMTGGYNDDIMMV